MGYNRVFGYYLEVTRPHLGRVPDHYVRRQTLVNAERFITPELKEYESRILNAQERIAELESALFQQVCRQIAESSGLVLKTGAALAQVDVFAALAEAAFRHDYTRPVVDESDALEIEDGRHPIVERALPTGSFVPNATTLSNQDCSLVVLTGPNMAGKSTYIRQVALIVLMAQIGSFVPAASARIGLVDRIFTRVGLQDDLATGQSTFMVEMVETAAILHHATRRSLVVLDEIGRGTSTYDGLAIAHAVAEFIHNHPRLGCKTLFATHYHELADLATSLPRACNYNVAVAEEDGNGRLPAPHRARSGGQELRRPRRPDRRAAQRRRRAGHGASGLLRGARRAVGGCGGGPAREPPAQARAGAAAGALRRGGRRAHPTAGVARHLVDDAARRPERAARPPAAGQAPGPIAVPDFVGFCWARASATLVRSLDPGRRSAAA